jgi:AcrR family transcriptional regulator
MARPRSDIAPRIVHAARGRFLSDGVDGASLRSIASDAGTSIGMVYYYFPTKDDLFLAVVEEVYVKLLADMEDALSPKVSVEARISRLYRRIGAMSDVELLTLQLIVREGLVSSSRLQKLVERFQRGHLPLVIATVADGLGDGTLRSTVHPAVVMIATLAMGVLPQVLRRVAGAQLPFAALPSGEALSDALVDVLLRGVGTRG